MAFSRLDHVIFEVPDIERAHRELLKLRPEAWPVGRFWDEGRTSAVALGGFNLELIQPDKQSVSQPRGRTMVFAPSSIETASDRLRREQIPFTIFEKYEDNPELLAMRGFNQEETRSRQHICTNLVPADPDSLPFEFFICSYSPILAGWLSPSHPRLAVDDRVTELVYAARNPHEARRLLVELGYSGPTSIQFVAHEEAPRILEIHTKSGRFPWP